MSTYDLALSAIASGILVAIAFVWGYYTGRKDQTPGDRK
jgi:hypothetical protein